MQGRVVKVIHVFWTARTGGIQKLVISLAAEQNRREDLEAGICILKNEGELFGEIEAAGIPCHVIGLRSGYSVSRSRFRTLLKILKQYDLIHLHDYNPLTALMAIRSGRKIVYSEHGNFSIFREKKVTDPLLNFMEGIFLRKYPVFITYDSDFARRTANRLFKTGNKNQRVIYNGIPETGHSGNTGSMDPGIPVERDLFRIGTLSRLAKVKRVERLIGSFSKYRYRDRSMLIIAGDGPLKEKLNQQAAALNLGDRILFTGMVKDPEAVYSLLDVFVLPSNNEAFGLTVVEALSHGKPVLLFGDAGGAVEIVDGIEPENIVGDEEGMARRLEYYFEHRDRIAEGARARKDRADLFRTGRMEREYYEAYREILK
ncbi:MAG TPA: glycosyltransferase [Bacteroidales bacterium]|nr:glycosyltransferase [Bacteroidales bacterium]